ncbi:MAG: hypothetical protein IT214_05685 [Chitinophagaceae bacterium]|nr:hypothetical protein [Chitinophagaceae bacterium]
MKKYFLFLAFALVTGISCAFAGVKPEVSPRVQHSFEKEFPKASVIAWGEDEGYIKATFVMNYSRMEAWFNEEGKLLGAVRNLSFSQLPLNVVKGINNRYPSANVIEILEITNEEGTTYRVTANEKNKTMILVSTPEGHVVKTGRVRK